MLSSFKRGRQETATVPLHNPSCCAMNIITISFQPISYGHVPLWPNSHRNHHSVAPMESCLECPRLRSQQKALSSSTHSARLGLQLLYEICRCSHHKTRSGYVRFGARALLWACSASREIRIGADGSDGAPRPTGIVRGWDADPRK